MTGWRPDASWRPDEPVDLDSLVFVTRDGIRVIVDPNRREHELARRLLADRGMWQQGLGEHTLAVALAAVREGSTLEGQRSTVNATYTVPRRVHDTDDGERRPLIRRAVRQRWARELFDRGLRPIGWPPVIARGYRHGDLELEHEVPLDRADLVVYRVESEAVPE